jgi:hypothetical protein
MPTWSTPINVMANVLDNLQSDPKVAQLMLGVGMAADAAKNVPVDVITDIPHYSWETNQEGK